MRIPITRAHAVNSLHRVCKLKNRRQSVSRLPAAMSQPMRSTRYSTPRFPILPEHQSSPSGLRLGTARASFVGTVPGKHSAAERSETGTPKVGSEADRWSQSINSYPVSGVTTINSEF